MKIIQKFYNPAANNKGKLPRISLTSLFSWITVLAVIVLFWSGVAEVYKKDYVPRAIAKIEHKEKKFLATHKTLQKKFIGFRNSIS
jgi:hypothetical protein